MWIKGSGLRVSGSGFWGGGGSSVGAECVDCPRKWWKSAGKFPILLL